MDNVMKSYIFIHSPPQKKCAKTPLLTFLWSLARRKRKLDTDQIQYLHHIDTALTSCTYRESCRCLDCQVSLISFI